MQVASWEPCVPRTPRLLTVSQEGHGGRQGVRRAPPSAHVPKCLQQAAAPSWEEREPRLPATQATEGQRKHQMLKTLESKAGHREPRHLVLDGKGREAFSKQTETHLVAPQRSAPVCISVLLLPTVTGGVGA